MSTFLITPNMQLPNPVPGIDPGPDYANNLNSSLNIIDQHNHSTGNGVLINPNGLNINADLPFGVNNATLLRSVRFAPQPSPLSAGTDLGCLYVSGVDLYYNDVNGNQIKITASGTVNATSSGIVSGSSSAAFAGGVLVVKSSSTSGANVLLQSVELTNSGNLTNILTLQAPTLAGSSSLTLPVVPLATSFMQLDASGNMSASVPVVQGIQKTMLAPLGQQLGDCPSFITSSTSFTDVTGLTLTITTSGRPVFLALLPITAPFVFPAIAQSYIQFGDSAGQNPFVDIQLLRGATQVMDVEFENHYAGGANGSFTVPPNIVSIDIVAAGTYTYKIQSKVAAGTSFVSFSNCRLIAYEL